MAAPIHASCVANGDIGCLLLGPSGSGKSQLVAELVALGAELVADDQVQLTSESLKLYASPVPELAGVLELRGLGLMRHAHRPRVALRLAVQLGEAGERLPTPETWAHAGMHLPLLRLDAANPGTAAKLKLYLQAMQEGRILPQDWHAGRP